MFQLTPLACCALMFICSTVLAAPDPPITPGNETPVRVRLWPGDAPGALGTEPQDIPDMELFAAPADHRTGAAFVVCPGGGYGGLAPHEGAPIARWLNTLGITAAVLKYRLGPRYHHPVMLEDAARAIRTLRARSAEWGIDPHRVGIIGFSAGGHLASTAETHFDTGNAAAPDEVDRFSSRPELAVLVYPVITMGEFTHAGSRENLLGPHPSQALIDLLSNEKHVTAQTPPTFLVATAEDTVVPCENSLNFALALHKAGVPFELHLFEKGPHGFGLGGADPVLSTWPTACAAWLRLHGFAAPLP